VLTLNEWSYVFRPCLLFCHRDKRKQSQKRH
jgi:hypothetical protein